MTDIYDTTIFPYNGNGKSYMESLEIDSWNKFVDMAMESVGMSDNIEIKDFLYKYADSMVYESANSDITKLVKDAKTQYKSSLKIARKAAKTGDKVLAHKEINKAIEALKTAKSQSEKIMKDDATAGDSVRGFIIVTLIDCAKLFLVTIATLGIGTTFVAGYQGIKDVVGILQTSTNKKDLKPEDYNILWVRYNTLYSKLIKQLEVFDKCIDDIGDKVNAKAGKKAVEDFEKETLKEKIDAKAKDVKDAVDTKKEAFNAKLKDVKNGINAKKEAIVEKFKKESTDDLDENAASVVGALLPQGQGVPGVNDDTAEDMIDMDEDELKKDIRESYNQGFIYTTSMMCEAGGIKETADKIIEKIKNSGKGKDGEVRRNVVQRASKIKSSIILNQIRMKVEITKDPKNGKTTAIYKKALKETIKLEKDLRKVLDIMSVDEKSAFDSFVKELNRSSKETEKTMINDAKEARTATISTNQGDGDKINKKLGIKTEASEETDDKEDKSEDNDKKSDDKTDKDKKEGSAKGSNLSRIYYAQLDLLEMNQEIIVYKRAGIPDKIDGKLNDKIKNAEEKIKNMKEALNPAEKLAFTGFASKAQGVYNKYTSQAIKEITDGDDSDDVDAVLVDIVDQENAEVAKMYPKYLEDYLEESVNFIYSEAANIDPEIKEYIEKLNNKGYKTLYSSPGHKNIRAKEDPDKDGTYYGKIYCDARIMFDKDYKFGKAPKYWHWRQVDGKSYLDIIPITFNDESEESRNKQYDEWKEKYLKSLDEWIDSLPDASEKDSTKEDVKEDEKDDSKTDTKDTDTIDKKDAEEVKEITESVMTDLFASMGMIYG